VAGSDAVAQVDAALGSGSHLAAGVALAEAGFLQEAEEHFERLVALNPDSAEAKKLLELSRASRPRR
jgi:Flp pilus assembly protein TadD